MYTTFFGLRELPFPLANDPHFFYPTPATQNAEQSIITALQEHSGLALLTGEPGTGKTTLLHRIATSLGPRTSILLLPFAAVTFDDILTHVCDQFSIIPADNDQFTKILAIQEHLQTATEGGMRVILCIDEAQNLRKETLDRLRLLLHLKGPHGKLLQILLVGQQSLGAKLAHPDLRHIHQYISVHSRLEPLTRDAVRSFILHRLRIAGTDRTDIFTAEAIEKIAHYSQHVPRLINVICDNALIAAFLAGNQTVSRDLIDSVGRNLKLNIEEKVSESQGTRTGTHSVQKIVPSPQSPNRQWVNNLVWTGAGVILAWLSSSPQPFSLPSLNTFFITKSAEVLLPPASQATDSVPSALLSQQSQTHLAFTHEEESIPALNIPTLLPDQLAATQTAQEDTAPLLQLVPPTFSSIQAQVPGRGTVGTDAPAPQETHPSPLLPVAPPATVSSTPRESTLSTQTRVSIQKLPESSITAPIVSPTIFSESSRARTQPHPQQTPPVLQAPKVSRSPRTDAAKAPLINKGMQPTREALFSVVGVNDIQAVNLLLTAQAPVNAKDERGWTVLMIAARDNRLDLVRLLLAWGAVVNLANQEGETALMHAADNDHLAIVQILLDHGASIDTKSNLGWTALMYAAAKGHRLTVQTLLAKGANPGIKDKNGRTASMYATLQGNVPFREEQLRAPSTFRTRLDRLEGERLELVKRRDYREIALLLKEAETKR